MKREDLEKILDIKFLTKFEKYGDFEVPIFVVKGKYLLAFENENCVQLFKGDGTTKTVNPDISNELAELTSVVSKIDEYI